MIRVSFLIISIISLIYGLMFLLFPYWFVNFTEAEITNIAWLRNLGASIIGLLFFGSLSIFIRPGGKIAILKVMALTSIMQTSALIYSRFYNEFSAKNIIIVDLTIYLAIFISIYFAWLIFFKWRYFDTKFI